MALLLSILDSCTSTSNSIRLITLRLTIMLLTELLTGSEGQKDGDKTSSATPTAEGEDGAEAAEGSATPDGGSDGGALLQDHHIALVEHIYESAILKLRLHYKVCACKSVKACYSGQAWLDMVILLFGGTLLQNDWTVDEADRKHLSTFNTSTKSYSIRKNFVVQRLPKLMSRVLSTSSIVVTT